MFVGGVRHRQFGETSIIYEAQVLSGENEGGALRAMEAEDVPSVLDIIAAHDEDDAEEAAQSYERLGLDDQYVLIRDDDVVGVTGLRHAKGAIGAAWLSWTYVKPAERRKGHGRFMLERLFEHMRGRWVRKVFVSTSDYIDEQGRSIYAPATHLYEAAGFRLELTHPDYYAPGESHLVYGLALQDIDATRAIKEDETAVYFNGLNEIPETEGAYAINWIVRPAKLFGLIKPRQFTAEDIEIGLAQAREWQGRSVFIAFPSNMPAVVAPLTQAGFVEAGRLRDYYEDGLDEIHFRFNL